MMRFMKGGSFRSFFASLTILSVTFTQVAPAWALRGRTLRPEGADSSPIQAGIEEALHRSALLAPAATTFSQLPTRVALSYLAWKTSRYSPEAAASWYDDVNYRPGESDCRVCAMRGNVIQGLPTMLHLMLTGGYDGAGIDIKAEVNGKYYIIEVKDRGHLDRLLQEMFVSIDQQLINIVSSEYHVPADRVSPLSSDPDIQKRLEGSFELDEKFGDVVFRMKVGDRIISIPMEGIAHTRWATIGNPEKVNSHPFHVVVPGLFLPDGRPLEVALAHNGNFNTYELLRPLVLVRRGQIKGETDSEALAFVVGFMHRSRKANQPVAPLMQAVARAERFIKYVEDWRSLVKLIETETADAQKYHETAVEFLKQELKSWGVTVPKDIVEGDLRVLAKAKLNDILSTSLDSPWLFDVPGPDTRSDLGREFSKKAEAGPKAQTALRQRFFEPTYSTIAIAVLNNAERGVVVARGRTGGDLEVYVPPLQAVHERLREMSQNIAALSFDKDGVTAKGIFLQSIADVRRQVAALLDASAERALWLPEPAISHFQDLKRQLDDAHMQVEHMHLGVDLNRERERILALFQQVRDFAGEMALRHDPGKRLAASEPRAMPGIPGIARLHPEDRFRAAGRGEMDSYKVEMGNIIQLDRTIRRSSVWDDELKTPLAKSVPKRQMVDLENVNRGKAGSRLEKEINNQVNGWSDTLKQFIGGHFPDLNYSSEQLDDVREWIFVAEGTSNHLAQVAALVASIVPNSKIHFQVMTGKEFQSLISSGKLENMARDLASGNHRMMVTFASNTGQTETLRNGADQLNKLNQRLTPAEATEWDARVLPSVITNVSGSAVDEEVAKFDGKHHSVYTLVGYEMAVPATGSLNVGVMSAGLLVTYVQALTGAFGPGGMGRFYEVFQKFDQAARDVNTVLQPSSDGALQVTKEYRQYLDDVFGRMDPTLLDALIWITGWWVWKVGADESRLKLYEGFRSAGVSSQDIISGKHGPYAILRPGAVAVLFFPSSKEMPEGYEIVLQGMREIRTRVNASEKGGKAGQIIVLMDKADFNNREVKKQVSRFADVMVPLPHMDNPFTGFMYSMLFMQMVTLYGARRRFEPIRQDLIDLDRIIADSGILGQKIPVISPATGKHLEELNFTSSSELIEAFSETLTELDVALEKDAREVLAELDYRDTAHFGVFRQLAQRPSQTATKVVLDVLRRIEEGRIGQRQTGESWLSIRRYAAGAHKELNSVLDKLQARRNAILGALAHYGIDEKALRATYQRVDAFSLSPSEAIRFAHNVPEWQEYTETYVRHLSKQISGVEAGLEEEAQLKRETDLQARIHRVQREVKAHVLVYDNIWRGAPEHFFGFPFPAEVSDHLETAVEEQRFHDAFETAGRFIRQLEENADVSPMKQNLVKVLDQARRWLEAFISLEVEESATAAQKTWEEQLGDFLEQNRGRNPDEADWMVDLYRQYRQQPGQPQLRVIQDPQMAPGLSFVAMVIPYTAQSVKREPSTVINQRIAALSARTGQDYGPERLFVAEWREAPNQPLVAFIQVGFQAAFLGKKNAENSELVRGVVEALRPYMLDSPAVRVFLEQHGATPVSAPVSVPDDFLQRQVRSEALRQIGEEGLVGLYEMYQQTRKTREPQVRLYADLQNAGRSVVAIADQNREGLLQDIGSAVTSAGLSGIAEVGENYPLEPESGRRAVAFFLLDFGIPLSQLQESKVDSILLERLGEEGIPGTLRRVTKEVERLLQDYLGYVEEKRGLLPAEISDAQLNGSQVDEILKNIASGDPTRLQEAWQALVDVQGYLGVSAEQKLPEGMPDRGERVRILNELNSFVFEAIGRVEELQGKLGTQAGAEEKAKARGWIPDGEKSGFFITPQGGRVAVATDTARLNVNLDEIDATAEIGPTAAVMGGFTKIRAGAKVYGIVINAEVGRNATQRGILQTLASETNDWDPGVELLGVKYRLPFKPSQESLIDLDGKKGVIKAVLGDGAVVSTDSVVLTNTRVDSMDNEIGRTVLTRGVYKNTEIGEGNRHLTPVKADVTHFEPLVTVKTSDPSIPVEFAESWIGRGATFTHRGYIEATHPNLYVWAEHLKEGTAVPQVEVVKDFPAVGVFGQSTIYASYDATMKAKDPRLTRITGKESSIHAWILRLPGVLSSALTLIGRKHDQIRQISDLLTHSDLTVPGGFSALTNQVWGVPLPGSKQTDLSRGASEDPLWLFREHPEAVRGLTKEAWEQEKRYAQLRKAQDAAFDEPAFLKEQAAKIAVWPVHMLNTVITLATARSEADKAHAFSDVYPRVIAEAKKRIGEFQFEATPAALDNIADGFHEALAVADTIAKQSPLQPEQEVARFWREKPLRRPQDEEFFASGVTQPKVDPAVSKASDPTAVILGNNRLTGTTRIGRGVIVIGSELNNVEVEGVSQEEFNKGKRVWVISTRLDGGKIGPGSNLVQVVGDDLKVGAGSSLFLSRFSKSRFGERAEAFSAVAENTSMGSRAKLEAGARLTRVKAGEHVILGGIFEDSELGDGYTSHHTGSMGFGVSAPNVLVKATGQRVAGNTNHSDGVILGVPGRGANQVFLLGPVMFGANQIVNTVTPEGTVLPVTVGFGAFVKGGLNPGERVANFQFSWKPGPGGKLDPLKGTPDLVFTRVPGMPLRLLWSKQFAETSAEAKPSVAYAIPEALEEAVRQYEEASLGLSKTEREAAVQQLKKQTDGKFWESTYSDGVLNLTVPRKWLPPARNPDDKLNGEYLPESAAGVEELGGPAVGLLSGAGVSGGRPLAVVTRPAAVAGALPATSETGAVSSTVAFAKPPATGDPIRTVTVLRAELTASVPGVPSANLSRPLAFVVSPDGLPKFAAAVTVFGAQGVMADVVVRNAEHAAKVSRQLEQLGLTNVVVHDMESEFKGMNVDAVMDFLVRQQGSLGRQAQKVTAKTGLLEVAQFLGAAAAQSVLRGIQAIADRSNEVWS